MLSKSLIYNEDKQQYIAVKRHPILVELNSIQCNIILNLNLASCSSRSRSGKKLVSTSGFLPAAMTVICCKMLTKQNHHSTASFNCMLT